MCKKMARCIGLVLWQQLRLVTTRVEMTADGPFRAQGFLSMFPPTLKNATQHVQQVQLRIFARASRGVRLNRGFLGV